MGKGRGRENYSASEDGETRSNHLKPISYRIFEEFPPVWSSWRRAQTPQGATPQISKYSQWMNSNFYSKPDEQKQPVSFAPAGKRIQPFGLKRSRKRVFNFKSGSSGSLQRLHYSQDLLFSLGMKGKTTGEYLYQCSEAQKLPLHFGCSSENRSIPRSFLD